MMIKTLLILTMIIVAFCLLKTYDKWADKQMTCNKTKEELEQIPKLTKDQYNKEAVSLVLMYHIVRPCKTCGWPVLNPYCCSSCGEDEPY